MWESNGGATVYATHYGWPFPYLRVPTGDHAGKLPPDVFVPGLVIDLALVTLVCVAVLSVSTIVGKAGSRRDRMALSTEGTTPKPPRSMTRRLTFVVVGVLVLLLVGMAAVQVAIELSE